MIYCTYQCHKWHVSKIAFIKKFIIQIFLHKTNNCFFSLAYTRTLTVRLLTKVNRKEKENTLGSCSSSFSTGNNLPKQSSHSSALCFQSLLYNNKRGPQNRYFEAFSSFQNLEGVVAEVWTFDANFQVGEYYQNLKNISCGLLVFILKNISIQ